MQVELSKAAVNPERSIRRPPENFMGNELKKVGKITLLVTGILLVTLVVTLSWYRQTHSMETALAYEWNDSTFRQRILIATQGSKFKDTAVTTLVRKFQFKPVYIKVIDVSGLDKVQESDWDAIIILHTWENWKPQEDARKFIDRAAEPQKLIVLSTSASGRERMSSVDGMSSASRLSEVTIATDTIIARVGRLLYPVAEHKYLDDK